MIDTYSQPIIHPLHSPLNKSCNNLCFNSDPGLNNAVIATGACYEDIGKLYEEQPRLDWEHIADMMHDYKGLLSGWPQVLQIHSVCF